MKTRIYVKEPRGTLPSDRINGSKGTNSREKIPLGTSVSIEISRQFVTMESKYAFAIYLNTQYLGPNTWAGLARFAVLPRSRHPKFNFQTRSQGWQGCSTLWLHDHRDSSATSLPADVLWGSFVTHSFLKWMRDKRTPKDVCGEATRQLDKGSEPGWCNQALALIN